MLILDDTRTNITICESISKAFCTIGWVYWQSFTLHPLFFDSWPPIFDDWILFWPFADLQFGDESLTDYNSRFVLDRYWNWFAAMFDSILLFIPEYFQNWFTILGNNCMIGEGIEIDDLDSFLEGGEFFVFCYEVLGNWGWTSLQICILLDEGNNLVNHTTFWFFGVLNFRVIRIILGKIWIHPNFHFPIVIDTNQILLRTKIACYFEQLPKTIQTISQNIHVLWVRDIGDIAQPNWNMLNVYFRSIAARAELLHWLINVMNGIDDEILS